jgi:5-hydroxyisourate hydrolase
MASLSTHVLDAARGRPARGVEITLIGPDGRELARGTTDDDGRIRRLGEGLAPGDYRLRFATGDWFRREGLPAFWPEAILSFTIVAREHHHVPLLLSPFAYSTYRGS